MQDNSKPESDARMTRGLVIFETKGKKISENPDGSFSVPSRSNPELSYEVRLLGEKYVWSCPDFEQREMSFASTFTR